MKQVIWEGYHHQGGRARAVYDGNNVLFEQAKKRDAMDQYVWEYTDEPPVAFMKTAAEMMLKKGVESRGT